MKQTANALGWRRNVIVQGEHFEKMYLTGKRAEIRSRTAEAKRKCQEDLSIKHDNELFKNAPSCHTVPHFDQIVNSSSHILSHTQMVGGHTRWLVP